MTLALKQKISHETNKPIPHCWVTDCRYTVAMCRVGEQKVYQVTAPNSKAPFAYTPAKAEVRKIITIHKNEVQKRGN